MISQCPNCGKHPIDHGGMRDPTACVLDIQGAMTAIAMEAALQTWTPIEPPPDTLTDAAG